VTILDVRDADDPATFKDVVRGWAQSVWQAWQPYHDRLREWAIRLDRFGESRQAQSRTPCDSARPARPNPRPLRPRVDSGDRGRVRIRRRTM
jgi:hypothetical protein